MWGNCDIEISDRDKCWDEITRTSKFRSLCYQAFLKASSDLHIIENTTPDLCAMLPSPHNGSDCICPIFGAENKCIQCSEWHTCCVTSFGQMLYWRQILSCHCAPALLLDYWVLCVCPGTALLSVNLLPERWENSRHDLCLYSLLNIDFLCSYLKKVWSQINQDCH